MTVAQMPRPAQSWRPAVPHFLLEDDRLQACHQAMMLALGVHADAESGHCWPRQQTLAATLGISQQAVSARLKHLILTGWIKATLQYDRSTGARIHSSYRIHWDFRAPARYRRTPQPDVVGVPVLTAFPPQPVVVTPQPVVVTPQPQVVAEQPTRTTQPDKPAGLSSAPREISPVTAASQPTPTPKILAENPGAQGRTDRKLARIIGLVEVAGLKLPHSMEDRRALKYSAAADPDEIAACFIAVVKDGWGNSFLGDTPSLEKIIRHGMAKWLNRDQAAARRDVPRGGRARGVGDVTGSAGSSSRSPEARQRAAENHNDLMDIEL